MERGWLNVNKSIGGTPFFSSNRLMMKMYRTGGRTRLEREEEVDETLGFPLLLLSYAYHTLNPAIDEQEIDGKRKRTAPAFLRTRNEGELYMRRPAVHSIFQLALFIPLLGFYSG